MPGDTGYRVIAIAYGPSPTRIGGPGVIVAVAGQKQPPVTSGL